MNGREDFIDVAKGIGILLVVIGHVVSGGLRDFIYLFHMPLFFFISGFLFKPQGIDIFLKKKSKQLLIPYVSYLLLFASLWVGALIANSRQNDIVDFLLSALLGGGWLTGWFSAFWYITCFFVTLQVANLVSNLCGKFEVEIAVLFLLLALFQSYFYSFYRFSYSINVVLMAYPIFYMGRLYKECEIPASSIFVFASLVFSVVYLKYFDSIPDYKYGYYGVPVLSLFISLSLSISIIVMSEWIVQVRFFSFLLRYVGRASITIFFAHQFLQINIKHVLGFSSQSMVVVSTVVLCVLLHLLFQKYSWARFFFLGSGRIRVV